MPDTPETRMSRLERDVALVQQRLDDMRGRVSDLAVAAGTITRIEVTAAQLQAEVTNIRRDLSEREKEEKADRRSTRTAILGMTGAIMATIIGAVITLLIASGGHP